ncbi:alpha/beta fold hydrolase [Dyadobacter sp. NIV53]|uniref:alpha/beta fold hydrolase n=1 Tax=Dyadobacter sp. NIV53 TaxID=2861765 RepID=UPI001C8790BD|nr:alpha/beta hydrolase [Dyadobacter sp. NIV53]
MRSILTLFIFLVMISASFAQTSGFVDNGDCKTYFRTFGNKKPILIINGGPGMNSDGFEALAKTLSKNNQTIIYDQRGTGKSVLDKVDGTTITMKLMAEDIERLRIHLKIDKWIILGHSFGGMMASYYATIHPEHIESLILSSSGGIDLETLSSSGRNLMARLSTQETDSLEFWNNRIAHGDTTYHAKLHRGLALAPAYLYDRKNIRVIAERLTQSNMKVNGIVWSDLQKIKFDCRAQVQSFTAPVLIIQGKQDIIAESIAIKEQRAFKNSRMVLIDQCSHYGWLDQPNKYYLEINKFISGA